MNILQLNTSDIEGGAARAAYRIHKAIIAQGVDSYTMNCQVKRDSSCKKSESKKYIF